MKTRHVILFLCFLLFLTTPTNGFSHDWGYGVYPGRGYYDGYRSHYGGHHDSHHDNILWGATGFLIGTAFGAAFAPPAAYSYAPPVYYSPPPMCRYERYRTDPWGRTYVEAFVAPCR